MKTEFDIIKFLNQNEETLSPFAKRSSQSLGRKNPIRRDPFRLEFSRDETRILHCPPFRRLKQKTQVFLSPDNDHICTRLEHVLHVSSIAYVIGRCLNLNIDLINAIAKGHDLGHPPFGHAGERALDKLLKADDVAQGFKHEIHGLRVVDMLTNYGAGLNLTYEVRDGIITHCGESFDRVLEPDRKRDLTKLESITERGALPSTLEGCLVRMVDRTAYLGRDLEDGIKAGLIRKSDIPAAVARDLGSDNGAIIGRFVNDIIANSIDKDAIVLSGEVLELMEALKDFNYERIYNHPDVAGKGRKSGHILDLLYHELKAIFKKTDRGRDAGATAAAERDAPNLGVFFHFIKNTNYNDETPPWRIAADYIAGMTDHFAERTYIQLFVPTPVI
ncbi:MAG TPA: HD domain-containing protein [Chitinivibrionales bacterium]|nr:HD domain-containing protein [Chitinivibrionales bacterium]